MKILEVLDVILMTKLVSSCYEGHFLNGFGECITCPDHCQHCISSKHCSACEDGYWGSVCKDACSKCYPGTSCEKENGFCLDKCKDGYTGTHCDSACDIKCFSCNRTHSEICGKCSEGLYGVTCDKHCSSFCLNITCDDTGSCIHGCQKGYWGQMCEHSCSIHCKDNSCNRQSGTCIFGCEENYTGTTCNMRILKTIDEKQQTPEYEDKAYPAQGNANGNLGAQNNKGVLIGLPTVIGVVLLFVAAAVVYFNRRKRNDRQRKREYTDVPTGIPLLNKTIMDTSEDSGVCIKKCPSAYTTQDTEMLMEQIPAGQKGSSKFLYVSGFRGDNTYLVCPDPAAEQGDAFWEMVWQKNCNVIVKLSSSVEETGEQGLFLSKKKETQNHGSVSVTCIGGRDFDGYEERQYELEKQRKRKKQVTQMQFSHWPRDGFPENLPKLLEFRQKIKEITTQLTGSLLVLCTGGQSRSNTYIALDKALNEFEREDNADIHVEEYMDNVRDEGLISDVQFAFIRRTTDIWRASRTTESAAGSKYTQIEDVSNQEWSRQHIPAGPQCWFELRFVSDLCGVSTYLICEDSATEKGKTFWEMVWQKHCGVIVNFIGNVEETDENIFFLKKNERRTCGSVRVAFVRGTTFEGYEERQYELEKLTERKQVQQMQFSRWPRGGFPENLPKLLEFRQRIEKVRTGLTGPLCIYCSGEQSRSYTYIALDRVLNELERGNNSDTTVEQNLKRLRAERLVSSNEQISFLQKAIDIWRAPRSTQTGK